jgi:hypothetical protein
MRNPFRTRLRIGLSPNRVTLLHTGTLWKATESILADIPIPADPRLTDLWASSLRAALSETSCRKLSTAVIVADEWVRYFIVTPPQQVTNLQDCRTAAAMRFQSLYGEPANGWEIHADWDATSPFLACAMPAQLVNGLIAIAADFQLSLIRITPQFVASWNRWHRKLAPDTWLGSVQGNYLTLGTVTLQKLCAVRSQVLPAEASIDRQWLETYTSREALRLGILMPSAVQLCGNPPRAWLQAKSTSFACQQLDAPSDVAVSAGIMLARTGMGA